MVRLSMTTSPYWKTYVDGVSAKVIDQAGFIRLFIEAGEHVITLQYVDTVVKMVSNAITLVSLVLCVIVYVKGRPKRILRMQGRRQHI